MDGEAINNGQKSSYRSIFKATSLFGGVQVYQILIGVVRSKFIAILLGPSGLGIMGLYQSAIDLVKQVSSLGISQSAVRDISEANETGDVERIGKTFAILRRIVWWTGILGLVAVAALSPVLSRISFGNNDYTIPFLCLSVTLLLDQLCSGQKVVLQGMRRLRDLAKCSSIGVTLGLVIAVPLYYLFGIEGIVPTMILNSAASFVVAWIYARKIKVKSVDIAPRETLTAGKSMLTMGIAMSVSGLLCMGVAFALRSYIRSVGGTVEVGLFQAGFVIINSYVGLVFNAISTDYYPRLAAINKDNEKCRKTICQQGEIGTFILAPMLIVCSIFMPFVLKLLYSDDFLAANEYIIWCCLGMMFRLASWIISYVFIAKSESKLYIISEFAGNAYYLVFSLVGYRLWGLVGLGIAFALDYVIYFIQVYVIAHIRYRFKFDMSFAVPFCIQTVLVTISLLVAICADGWVKYAVGVSVILLSGAYSLVGLERRIGILSAIKARFAK